MTGIPTRFKILEATLQHFRDNPIPDVDIVALVENNLQFAYLGAVGPAIADYFPPDPAMPSQNPYFNIWKEVFAVMGGDGASFLGLLKLEEMMDRALVGLDSVAKAEDPGALKMMASDIDDLKQAAAGFAGVAGRITTLADNLQPLMTDVARPPIEAAPAATPKAWRAREFLYWKKSGSFLRAVIDHAQKEMDTDKSAQWFTYAFGYLACYAAEVCGSPFVNSIVGGPYRTQWWRHRWINNYVDAWVWGFYGAAATMPPSGDTPSPPYDDPRWTDLCSAKLHDTSHLQLQTMDQLDVMSRLRVGDAFLPFFKPPSTFSQDWFNIFQGVYGTSNAPANITPSAVDSGCTMLWLILWLQTGGNRFACPPPAPEAPKDDCGSIPSWVTSGVPGDPGGGSGPPGPQIEQETTSGSSVCGVIEAILGVVLLFTPAWALGVAAIIDSVSGAEDGQPDAWKKLRCDLFWYRTYLHNLRLALNDAVILAGLQYPHPRVFKGVDTIDSAPRVTKSMEGHYPAALWGGDTKWTDRPVAGFETPATTAYRTAGRYPDFFVDAAANPLTKGDVKTAGAWPARLEMPGGSPVEFGNAVENAADLVQYLVAAGVLAGKKVPPFPDWNLDADRGLAWLTWQFLAGASALSMPVAIMPES
jgi:hypothetical protein